MDLATLLGLVSATFVIVGAIAIGGDAMAFVNVPSMVIVFGGTFAATLTRISIKQFFGSFKVALKAFLHKGANPEKLMEEAIELAKIARKEGILALEDKEIENPFLKKGIELCIDGHPPEVIQQMLSKDINLTIERHDVGVKMFKDIGDAAPAMGMIGTLIGLVQMLSNMEDPKSIGPAMAVALLTTLYGAVIANAFALPIAEKLKLLSNEERLNKHLVLESISAIQSGINPRVMEQLLMTFLPESKRQPLSEQAA
jgi:chemotaxis protein MotA